jgi:hypothetical protein
MDGPLNSPSAYCTLLLIKQEADVPSEIAGFSQEQGHP